MWATFAGPAQLLLLLFLCHHPLDLSTQAPRLNLVLGLVERERGLGRERERGGGGGWIGLKERGRDRVEGVGYKGYGSRSDRKRGSSLWFRVQDSWVRV